MLTANAVKETVAVTPLVREAFYGVSGTSPEVHRACRRTGGRASAVEGYVAFAGRAPERVGLASPAPTLEGVVEAESAED